MAVLLCSNITYPLLVDIHLTFNSLSPRIIRFVVFIDPHQGLIMLTDAVD